MTEVAVIEALRGVQGVQATNALQAASNVQAAADPQAVAAFNQAMGVTSTDPVPFANQLAGVWNGAQDVYQGHLHRLQALSESTAMGTASVANMSALQYEMAATNFELEVTVAVAKKSREAVQTLVKNG